MLKSCKYCGRIHEVKDVCDQRKKAEEKRWQNRKVTDALKFRRTNGWTNKSVRIRERDNYLCLCCRANMPGTIRQYNTTNLSVHHIVPIEEDYNKRLADDNLITVCDVHHEMCEAGKISRDQQMKLVTESIYAGNKKEECIVM